jgi:hypothetical protein
MKSKLTGYSAAALMASVLVTVGGAVSVMALHPQPPWTGLAAFMAAYHPLQSVIFLPSIILPLSFVGILAGLLVEARPAGKAWGVLALSTGVVGAAVLCTSYLIQGLWVPALIRQKSDLVGSLVSTNPDSLFWTFELFGYGIIGLGTWLAAPLLGRTGRDGIIRRLLVANGIGSMAAAIGYAISRDWVFEPLGLGGVLVWNALVFILGVMLFRRSSAKAG